MDITPVYTVSRIASQSDSVEWHGILPLVNEIQNGWAILWQVNGVFSAQIKNGKIQWLNEDPKVEEKFLVRLRIFNDQREYHFWKSNQKIKGRVRIDEVENDAENFEVVDSDMVIRGFLFQQIRNVEELDDKYIFIRTRNYVDHYPETQQATFNDSRFVKFFSR